MIAESMVGLVNNNSVIREMFEEGKRLAKMYGEENVFDFSLGNPNVPAPKSFEDAVKNILDEEPSVFVHGYMSNAGYEDVRETVAASLNERFGTHLNLTNIIMTVGAAGGMNVVFRAMLNPGDEVITFSPYFLEYNNYVANYNGRLIALEPNTTDFQANIEDLERKITPKTKALIINNPNNPTGVVYSEATIRKIASILEQKQKEFGTQIFIISDEPYRELAYDGVEVPFITKYYDNTIVGYSFSKSLSLPGERIGYLVIPDEADDAEQMKAALSIATRVLGFVNAPSLMQRAVARCINEKCDVASYDRNRKALYDGLVKLGFECVEPQGAFYLFVKSPVPDEKVFCEAAKKYNILFVPGSSFNCPGYVRIAYCVAYDTIINSLPKFGQLAKEMGLV